MPSFCTKVRVISSGDKEKEIMSNVAYVKFERPIIMHDELDVEEFKILIGECFDDIFCPTVSVLPILE